MQEMHDSGSIPGWGRSLGEGNGDPLQYSCLENPMDRGAWWAAVHGSQRVEHNWVTKQHNNKRSGWSHVLNLKVSAPLRWSRVHLILGHRLEMWSPYFLKLNSCNSLELLVLVEWQRLWDQVDLGLNSGPVASQPCDLRQVVLISLDLPPFPPLYWDYPLSGFWG